MKCPYCRGRVERNPDFDRCESCGWEDPGMYCPGCGRNNVGKRHKTPNGDWHWITSDY